MPVILPSPDEMTRLNWREREIARANVRRALVTLARLEQRDIADLDEVLDQAVAKLNATSEWAAGVRADARRLQAMTPAHPDAAAHRAAVLEAIYA